MYGEGVSREGDLIDIAVEHKIIEKSGAWFAYGGERLGQGRENVKTLPQGTRRPAHGDRREGPQGARHVAAKPEPAAVEAGRRPAWTHGSDTSLLHHVLQLRRPWLDDVMVLSPARWRRRVHLGRPGAIAAVFPARSRGRVAADPGALFTWMVVDVVDQAHRRSPAALRGRSTEIQLIDRRPVTASFPSGHAAMAVAGAIAGSAHAARRRLGAVAARGWSRSRASISACTGQATSSPARCRRTGLRWFVLGRAEITNLAMRCSRGRPKLANPSEGWWPGRELNPRHHNFQSCALPTELPGLRRDADYIAALFQGAS